MEKVKVSDPMRWFTLVVSPIFVAIGVMAIVSGNSDGWLIAGFFSLCLLVAIFEPWFRKPWVSCDYRLVMTKDEIAFIESQVAEHDSDLFDDSAADEVEDE